MCLVQSVVVQIVNEKSCEGIIRIRFSFKWNNQVHVPLIFYMDVQANFVACAPPFVLLW